MFQCLQAQDFPKSGIYSDTLSGLYAGILILSGIYSGILSGIYSGILSSILSDILLHYVWHSIWHLFWYSILPFYLAFYSGILSGILSWHSIWHSILALHLAFYQISLIWALPDLNCERQISVGSAAVEVQQWPLRSGALDWGPAVPTDMWSSGSPRLRSWRTRRRRRKRRTGCTSNKI